MNPIRVFLLLAALVLPSRSAIAAGTSGVALAATAAAHEVVRPGDFLCYYLSPVDGTLQPYYVYVPTSYDPSLPTPVVFSLHGFGGRTGPAGGGWRAAWADANRWLLVRPDGRGNQNWDSVGEDDIFYVLRDLTTRTPDHPAFSIDPLRLYAEGGSMGGHGAFRLATRHAGIFAATAPVAGWTTYKDFYAHWYDAADPPKMGGYVDPAFKPLLETASSLFQAENALWSWMYVTFDNNDGVNPPWNALDMIDAIHRAGGVRVSSFEGARGHCGSYSLQDNLAFLRGKTLDPWPRTVKLTTNTLRYNRAYWLTIDRLRVLNEWARLEAHLDGNRLCVKSANVLEFGMELDPALVGTNRTLVVAVEGSAPVRVDVRPHVRLKAVLGDLFAVVGWRLAGEDVVAPSTPNDTRAATGGTRKTGALCGPIGDAFRSRFDVIYGAQPNSARGAAGTDREDALRFAADWNARMALQWGNEKPPRERRDDWWVPPYPFKPGRDVHPETTPLAPRPDTNFTFGDLPRDRNLVLFGDPDSNWIVASLAAKLPIEIERDGAGGVRIHTAQATYAGRQMNYLFVAPNPLAPQHYVVVARGYLSSRIDPSAASARNVGKDLELLPFGWPDYVIWDGGRQPGRTVQDPLRYLPDTFVEAGYFDENWRLRGELPVPRLRLFGQERFTGSYVSPVTFRLDAAGAPGGFGLAGIEYQVNGGPWTRYREPVVLAADGPVKVRARALHKSGQFVYTPRGQGRRGAPAPPLRSETCGIEVTVRPARSAWQWLRGLFGSGG